MNQLALLKAANSAFPTGTVLDKNGDGKYDGIDADNDGVIDMVFVDPQGPPATGIDIDNDGKADFYLYTTETGSIFNTKADGSGTTVTVVIKNGILQGYDTNSDGTVDKSPHNATLYTIGGGAITNLSGSLILSLTVNNSNIEYQTASTAVIPSFNTSLFAGDYYNLQIVSSTVSCGVVNGSGIVSSSGIAVQPTINCGLFSIGNSTVAMTGVSGKSGISDGTGSAAGFNNPKGMAVLGGNIYVADTANKLIRKIVPSTGVVTVFAGGASGGGTCAGVASATCNDATGTAAQFLDPEGITADTAANRLYVADTGNHCIRRINTVGTVTTVAGSAGTTGLVNNANPGLAQFSSPKGVVMDVANTILYIADTGNNAIRKYDIAGTGAVTTLATGFSAPEGITINSTFNAWYVADTGSHTIKKIVAGPVVTTFSGTGIAGFVDNANPLLAQFSLPKKITIDNTDTNLYVADTGNHSVRKIVIATAAVSTIAGTGTSGLINGNGVTSSFFSPNGIAFSSPNIYLSDTGNHVLRQISSTTPFTVSMLAGLSNTVTLSLTVNSVFKEIQTISAWFPALLYNSYSVSGDNFNVQIVSTTQPGGCHLTNNVGTISTANITNIAVICP
ncbi:MAG: hypothetical protein OEV66_05180 [Spirochaetia bacterium]|nr:hypothetical protein [Spirochaetia bacterium]